MTVRTRFAPSPTGFLHVGGLRTALFSWLYAKHHQGQFILRIEDTDRERSTQESVQAILDGMAWLGLESDEGPYHQTDRLSRYQEVAQQFLEEGKAYPCTCSKERLEALRAEQLALKKKPRYDGHCRHLKRLEAGVPYVIRFKNPEQGAVAFSDAVYGDIQVENQELDDLILLRSDGHPTYNFAVVIDDADMNITHVIRGDDHINNTPRQIHLFKALGAPLPVFAHLPMILGEDGKRLSKRHGAVSVLEFKELGLLPHALLNYLVRLGWSHGDQEIFSKQEMIEYFDLQSISRGAASFNYDKLYWLNQHYQREDAPASVAEALRFQLEKMGIECSRGPALEEVVVVQAERCKTLAEMAAISRTFFVDDMDYDEEAVKKHWQPTVLEPLTLLYQQLQGLEEWKSEGIQSCIQAVVSQYAMNMGKIAQPLRVAVTGSSNSPSIDKTLVLLGKTKTLTRLAKALEKIKEL